MSAEKKANILKHKRRQQKNISKNPLKISESEFPRDKKQS